MIQEALGYSGLGQNKPRSLPHSASHLDCIPAQAGLDTVLDSSTKTTKHSLVHN